MTVRHLNAFITLTLFLAGCVAGEKSLRDRVFEARDESQISYESADSVFFLGYPNPFYDRVFLWFYNGTGQDVQLEIADETNKSVYSYTIDGKTIGQYTLEFITQDQGRLISNELGPGTVTILINGRKKCSVRTIIRSSGKYQLKVLPVPVS